MTSFRHRRKCPQLLLTARLWGLVMLLRWETPWVLGQSCVCCGICLAGALLRISALCSYMNLGYSFLSVGCLCRDLISELWQFITLIIKHLLVFSVFQPHLYDVGIVNCWGLERTHQPISQARGPLQHNYSVTSRFFFFAY